MGGSLSDLKRRFQAAPYNAGLGVQVESVDADAARVRVPYKDENANPGRALHGGVAASTIGICGALAAQSGFDDISDLDTGTLDLSVNYLAAAIGEDILATAEVLRRGKEIVYSDVDVRNEAGKRIARGLVTYRAILRGSLPESPERQRTMPAETKLPEDGDVPKKAHLFVSLPFIARLGMSIVHARDGEAVMHMPFKDDNADDNGAVHEGALAALMDTTGAMASWSITGLDFSYKASTAGMHANYHTPACREDVVAHARTLRRNNEIFLNR
jgi:uncharacterized protein (TIGR00369 family)